MLERYSAAVLDHFEHPRNVGRLDGADPRVATGWAGSAAQGAVIRLQIRIVGGVIETVRFKAYGCPATIAAASLLGERLQGLALEAAKAIEDIELAEALALPAEKIHAAVLAVEAFRAAVADYNSGRLGGI